MTGLGTVINTGAIIAGGLAGICIGGAMEKMPAVSGQSLESGRSMVIILSFVSGSLIGEFLNIEMRIEQFGSWLKRKTGNLFFRFPAKKIS